MLGYSQNNLNSGPKHPLQICISCENVSLIGYKQEVELFNYKICARTPPAINTGN
jgi:hypothetical protein